MVQKRGKQSNSAWIKLEKYFRKFEAGIFHINAKFYKLTSYFTRLTCSYLYKTFLFVVFKISVGHCGVWGINSEQSVFYRLNTYGDPDNEGTGEYI